MVTFENGEGNNAVLDGFTLQGGNGDYRNPWGWYNNFGGAIYCYNGSSPTIENVIISGNSAQRGGGIACILHSSPHLLNVLISGNSAILGGGVYCDADANPSLVNVTISGNSASECGGGFWCIGGSQPTLVNSVLWNDSPQEIYFYGAYTPCSITISYSDIKGGQAGIVTNNNGTVNWLAGNIQVNPLFVDGSDYHLQFGSPCIDAGNNNAVPPGITTDLDGNSRFVDDPVPDTGNGMPPIVDMGAYENSHLASNPSPADDANCVEMPEFLSWSPGYGAVKHDVYLGVDFNDVNNATTLTVGIFKGRQYPNSYYPIGLQPCSGPYDWRIDEVQSDGFTIYKGEVWSFTICCPCQAFESRDDIKWSQPPERNYLGCINGWDEVSIYYNEPIIADDWRSRDNKPIKDIHWWGSFKGWTEPNQVPPAEMPDAFHIGIWTDVPDPDPNDPNNFSHPGKLIWEKRCESYVWSYAGCDLDPRGEGELDACFKFDQLLSQDKWFYQESNEPNGTVYWLSIAAIYDGNTPAHPWGWKTRPHFYNDDAVRITSLGGQWPPVIGSVWAGGEPIEYPAGTSWDVAFVLTANREYQPMKWWWPPQADSRADLYEDGKIDFKDMAVLAGNWLTEGQVWPEVDLP